MDNSLTDLESFYRLLEELEKRGGRRQLAECNGRMQWPRRGVYFFFEPQESRSISGRARVVRVGTHALKTSGKGTLWSRLYNHRGTADGGGSHRTSIFRQWVGMAIKNRNGLNVRSWSFDYTARDAASRFKTTESEILGEEAELERAVSRHIGVMPFLWLEVSDEPGPQSDRKIIERNSIALLSSNEKYDPPSSGWFGFDSRRNEIQSSGLWNIDHVGEPYDRSFLKIMQRWVVSTADLPVHTADR